MNAAAKIARKTEPAPLLPEQIREKLVDLKAKSVRLLKEGADLAERSIEDPAAEGLYHQNVAESVAVDGEIRRLEAGLASMEAKATERAGAERATEAAEFRKRVAGLLAESESAALEAEADIARALASVRKLADLRVRACMAWPGVPPGFGFAFTVPEIQRLISFELYRANGLAPLTGGAIDERRPVAWPAPQSPNIDLIGQPLAIPPLSAAIADANVVAKRMLEKKS
jgi:hypothetical protein